MVTDTDSFGNYRAILNTGPYPLPTPTSGTTQIVQGNPNSLGTIGSAGSFAYDAVGNALYYTANGSTWVQIAGGSGSSSLLSGNGSPIGVANATVAPSIYIDKAAPNQPNFWYTNATGTGGWIEFIGS